jgi:hypothetical protein
MTRAHPATPVVTGASSAARRGLDRERSEVLVGMQFNELKQKVAQRTTTLRAGCLCVERHATRRAEPQRRGIAGLGGDLINVVTESGEHGSLQLARQSHPTGNAGQLGSHQPHRLSALGAEELDAAH